MKKLTIELIKKFEMYLINEEKSKATIEKYIRDITAFMVWIKDREVNKTLVIEYKTKIIGIYAPSSANSMLSSMNSFFTYMEWYDCKVKIFKIQRQIFANKEKELPKNDYEKLLKTAKSMNKEKSIC